MAGQGVSKEVLGLFRPTPGHRRCRGGGAWRSSQLCCTPPLPTKLHLPLHSLVPIHPPTHLTALPAESVVPPSHSWLAAVRSLQQ